MLKGLTKAGLGQLVSDEHLIELASAFKFEAVDLEAFTFIEQYGLEKAQYLLKKHNVQLGSINLSVEWRGDQQTFLQGIAKLAEQAAAAAALGCTSCCTYILPSTDAKAAAFMATAIHRLRICAQILGAYGIRLGLEFVGTHHLRTHWANPFIWTLDETLALIEAIDEKNVGLLLDSYHCHTNELNMEEIKKLKAEQIVHVHINDAPNVPVSEVVDNERLYPGEGVIDLVGFIKALQEIGYKGIVAQEVLADNLSQSAEELALRSKQGFDKVFALAKA